MMRSFAVILFIAAVFSLSSLRRSLSTSSKRNLRDAIDASRSAMVSFAVSKVLCRSVCRV